MYKNKRRRRTILFFVTLGIVLFLNIPVILILFNSLRTTTELLSDPGILPAHPTLENYVNVSTKTPYWTWFLNSLIVTFGGTLLCILSGTLAGYALSRFRLIFLTIYSRSLLMLQTF